MSWWVEIEMVMYMFFPFFILIGCVVWRIAFEKLLLGLFSIAVCVCVCVPFLSSKILPIYVCVSIVKNRYEMSILC